MKSLVIGAAGFVGAHLINQLLQEGNEVIVTKLPFEHFSDSRVVVFDLDILEKQALQELLLQEKPEHIYHLAAQSSVAESWKNPELTVDVNIKGALNLLETVRSFPYSPRILLVGSGEEYGKMREEEYALSEEHVLSPGNIYALTKASQTMLGKLYASAYGLDILMVRAFNHIGPGQASQFVISDFCRQVALIEAKKQEPVILVGNLNAKRDFTDVRDVVTAYTLLMKKGRPGEIYNVGSGEGMLIKDILDIILNYAKCRVTVKIDSNKFRPIDTPVIIADTQKIKNETGWQKTISIQQTIQDCLNDWRKKTEEIH